MPVDRNQDFDLVVEHPVAGGRMLARVDGQVILVAGAIPGERVRAIVEPSPKRVVFARTVEVLDASPDRRDGPIDPACGGLVYGHIAPARQRALKALVVADAFRRIAKAPLDAPPDVAESPETGYRLRARLHIRGGRAGFFREQTHDLCDAAATGQLPAPSLAAVTEVVHRIGPRAADCDSVVVAETVRGDARVVHLVPQPGAGLHDIGPELEGIAGVTGISWGSRGAPARLAGSDVLEDRGTDVLPGAADAPAIVWRRHAASFFQANRFLVGALTSAVLKHATGDRVVDLYAGVGLFSLPLAARGTRVLAVEGDETSAADLIANAAAWPALDVYRGSVEQALAPAPAAVPDAVVVDPPRTGMSPDALGALIRWEAPCLVYVSCDPPTLARDAHSLLAAGYRLAHIEAFDFFPNTAHVETLAVFEKG